MKKKGKRASFRFLWITDPWSTLDHPRDTSLRLAEEALAQGAESYWADVRSIRREPDGVRLDASRINRIYPGRAAKSFSMDPAQAMAPTEFDSLHYRVDPPVDLAYLQPLQLLVSALEAPGARKKNGARRAELVNPARVLCMGNEKLEAAALGALMPASLAASQWDALNAFGRAEGRAVLKPLHQAQSKGIELLDWRDPDGASRARAALKAATDDFSRPVLLQHYLEGIAQGEQRLWFVDGKLIACIRKLPVPGDFRVNMDGGSKLAPTQLSKAERAAAAVIGKHLARRRIRLAAVDLIDGKVTDFNFTSPGLIVQMEGILGENLAKSVVKALATS